MKKVLMIEDFPVLQKLYGEYLKKHGFLVVTVGSASDALKILGERQFDFILLDLLLPKINGIEFLEKFKPKPNDTKVLVLSDFNDPKTVKKAHELGIEKFLIKAEHNPSELLAVLNSYS